MNSRKILSLMVACSIATSGLAFAQGRSDHGDRGDKQERKEDKRERKEDKRDDKNDRYQERRYEHSDRGDWGRAHNGKRWEDRGAGPNHSFYKGQRLPVEYRARYYVVEDWRGHSLSAPPRGYHWVQTGNDYVLIAIASGLIAQLLLGNY